MSRVLLAAVVAMASPALGFHHGLPLHGAVGAGRAPLAAAVSRARPAARGGGTGVRMMADGTMPNKKVVVTGLGCLSSVGNGADEFFPNLFDGKIGPTKLPAWADDFPCNVAGQLDGFAPADWYANKKEAKRQSRYMNMCVASSKLGMADAKLDKDGIADKARFGIFVGSAIGGSEFYEEASKKWSAHSEYGTVAKGAAWGDASFGGREGVYKGPEHLEGSKFTFEGFKKISPFIVPSFIMNSGSGVAAVEVDAQGPNYCIGGYGGEGAGGAMSIGQAHRFLSTGECDVFIAGGSEAFLTPAMMAGFNQLKHLATGDAPVTAPFSSKAAGYLVGEAAGVLVLETQDHATKRGADPYCMLAGFGSSHEVVMDEELGLCAMPTPSAVAQAVKMALKQANVKPEDVGYVCAHGSGIIAHDRAEAEGIKMVFGDRASKGGGLVVSGIKGQTGNCVSASAGLEAAVCAYAIKHGKVPGTVTNDSPDTESGLDLDCLAGKKSSDIKDLKVAVSLNMALGGQATALVFTKC